MFIYRSWNLYIIQHKYWIQVIYGTSTK